jgi:hypothetical protein
VPSFLRLLPLLGVLVALIAPASAQAVEIGLNVNGGAAAGPADAAQLADTHAKWGRHFLFWNHISSSQWGEYERIAAANNARGVKTLLTVTGDGAAPDPAQYASYVGQLAARLKGQVAAYEIYNEADGTDFWHGSTPAAYTDLLQRAYTAIKNADPAAKVIFSPTVGNNFEWVDAAYKAGAKGYFDAMAVHTDTACLVDGPGKYYRDEAGRLARFVFLGYRTVRETMLAHGDDKPIWMTEFGWSTAPGLCQRGTWAGKKDAGVSEANQAQFMREAYHCMKEDPYLEVAMWFNSRDLVHDRTELNNYGLKRFDGSDRPSTAAFRDIARGTDTVTGPCGDFGGPQVSVVSPKPSFVLGPKTPLMLKATSSDPDLMSVSFAVKGAPRALRTYSNYPKPLQQKVKAPWSLHWMGAKYIPAGAITIVVTAKDLSGNATVVEVPGVKVGALPVKFGGLKIGGAGKMRSVTGRVKSSLKAKMKGRVRVEWQKLQVDGTWKKVHSKSRKASKRPVRFKQRLKGKGEWRVRLRYTGKRPFKSSSSKWLTFTV